MAQDNRTLEERIRDCRSASELQDLMTASRTFTGTFTRNREGGVDYQSDGATLNRPSTSQSALQPAADPAVTKALQGLHLLTEQFQMPDGSLREISAYSYSGLDAFHAQMLRLGGRRIGGNA
jgi:hypothetical protein